MKERITAKSARYIRLGPRGKWAEKCFRAGILLLAHREIHHEVANCGDRSKIREHFIKKGFHASISSDKTREVADFFDGDETVLWFTFHNDTLWWCIAGSEVVDRGVERTNGNRYRKVKEGWSNSTIAGAQLHISDLDPQIADMRNYRKTSRHLKEGFDDLIAKLNADR